MENNVLVITGMHRSGTSLITQWLHTCGLHVGAQLMGPGLGNEDGHFEDLDFFNYHRQALGAHHLGENGFIHHTLKALPEKHVQQLKVLLQSKNAAQEQWGWKDPRTCLFLDLYRQLLPRARYLVIWRSYQQVVSSMLTRLYQFELEQRRLGKSRLAYRWWSLTKGRHFKAALCKQFAADFLKVWINYNEAILRHIGQLPHTAYLVVDHASLPAKARQVFDHLSGQWHFKLHYQAFETVYKEKLLSPVIDLDPYITDTALRTRAARVQQQLATAGKRHVT
jgi:hypothetical protein